MFFRPQLCFGDLSCVSENLAVFSRPQVCFSDLSCVCQTLVELLRT